MATRLTLTCDGMDPFPLVPTEGVRVTMLDLGAPEIRAVAEALPGQSGTVDSTRYFGARVVTIEAQLVGTPTATRQDLVDRIAAFARPDRRPTLTIQSDGRPARAVDLRVEQWSSPQIAGGARAMQVSWAAPSGVIRSAERHIIALPRRADTEAVGRQYPLEHPRSWTPASPAGGILVANAGTLPAAWRLRIYGECDDPTITADGTPLVEFDSATVPAGSYWECDQVERTVYADSLPGSSRRAYLDYAASTWSPLPPGTSTLIFDADNPSTSCRAEIEFFDTWIT